MRDLADLYHGRWSIEELYKISKQLLTGEEFHGQTERTVQQELFAHFSLIALARLFTNRSEESFRADPGKPAMQANFKSSLRTVARHLEGLFLEHAAMLGKTVERILAGIAACRQRQRPNRSFPAPPPGNPPANGGPARQPQLQPQPEARKTGPLRGIPRTP